MRRYYALMHKDKNSAFGVSFPDLPAVYSTADKETDVIANAVEALQLYFENIQERPRASSIEALTARDNIKRVLSDGAFLISIPLIENDAEIVHINVTFERGLLNSIDAAAKARGLNRTVFLATAARHEIEV